MSFRPILAAAMVFVCLGQAAMAEATNTPVTQDTLPDATRQAIIDHFRKTLLVPELALWKFVFTRHYPTGGLAVCGQVNFTNSTRRYVGYRDFYARIVNNAVDSAAIVSTSIGEDPVRATLGAYRVACVD